MRNWKNTNKASKSKAWQHTSDPYLALRWQHNCQFWANLSQRLCELLQFFLKTATKISMKLKLEASTPRSSLKFVHFGWIPLWVNPGKGNIFPRGVSYLKLSPEPLHVLFRLLCRLRSKAAHRDNFVRRLSVRLCLSGSHTFLVVTHSYVSQATHAFLGMVPLCW